MIKDLSLEDRYRKAKVHILDALQNKPPRPVYLFTHLTTPYYVFECIQSSLIWDWLTFFLSYLFMYLVILEGNNFALKISL